MLSSNAIVISQTFFGESDKYVQFFTKKWGMITTLAKAARKSRRRYAGGLDLFCHDEIFLRGLPKKSPYLAELTVLNSFSGIRNDLERLAAAGKITQWIKKLADTAVPMPDVFSLLGQTLSVIEKEPDINRLELLCLIFKLKLLLLLGLKPSVEACTKCSSVLDHRFFFDIDVGGTLCENCAQKKHSNSEHFRLSPRELSFIKLGYKVKLIQWNQVTLPSRNTFHLNKLMTDFASFHTHTRLPN